MTGISRMVDESMDKEQLALPPQPWEFRSKPAWQRLIIMLGGVTVNVIAAIVIYVCVVFAYGEEQLQTKDLKAGIAINPYLEQYGLVSGDNIVALDGEKVTNPSTLTTEVLLRGKRKLSVVHANGEKETIVLPQDIDYKIFENGAFPTFELRSTCYTVDSVIPNKAAEKAKMKTGDEIISINNQKIEFYDNVQSELYKSRSKNTIITVLREKDTLNLSVSVPKEGILGFIVKPDPKKDLVDYSKIKTIYFNFGGSIGKGISLGYNTLNDYVSQMKFLFTSKGATEIGGFASIGKMFPSEWNWEVFWLNTAFISIALAFMNILPFPALDGGHVVFLLFEMITGKEAPQKVLEYAQYVGFFILIGLTLYANGNDLFKWLTGG